MDKIRRKLKRTKKVYRYTYYIISILYLISFIFFAKSIISLKGIETIIRIIILIGLFIYFIIYVLGSLVNIILRKNKTFLATSFLSLILIGVFSIGSYYINIIYNSLGNIQEKETIEYVTYLISLNDTEFNSEKTIGRITSEVDANVYDLAESLYVKEKLSNTIKDYDDYIYMLKELVAGNVDAVFVPSNYLTLYGKEEGLENLEGSVKILYEYKETKANEDLVSVSDKDFNEPLTFLVMGVDSEHDGLNANAAFNGDTLMLVSFNPHTLRTTMVSIPRDTYVPIACKKNAYSKINSAAGGGTNCVVETVENFLDVDIDYYAKINFKGVVELVDAIGGIDVDVAKPDYTHHHLLGINCKGRFCEQNSNRGTKGKDVIYIDPGMQHLNGEQALAYSRSRYMYAGGDLDRIKHQQQVVEALASKMLSFESISDFQKILTAVSNNMITNMDRSKILSGYNVIKKMLNNALKGEDLISIDKAYLETYSLSVYVPAQHGFTSAQGYYVDSLDDIKNALQETLGFKDEKVIKTFSFSTNEPYVVTGPGSGKRKKQSLTLLPDFTGKAVGEAETFCNNAGIDLSIKYVDPGSDYYNANVAVGLIGRQSEHGGTLMNNVHSLTVYIVNTAVNNKPEPKDPPKVEQNNSEDNEDEDNIIQDNNEDDFETETPSEEEIDDSILDMLE